MRPALQRRVQRYGWDKAAEFYETSWKEPLRPAQDKLMEMAALHPGESVLETACGTGLVTFRMARAVEPGGKVVATDLSDGMLKLAKEQADQLELPRIFFQRMDAEELDLEDDSFDAALCPLGLMYVPDPVEALREMHRVLKPGGRAVVAIWGARKNCGWAEIFPIVDRRVASDVCPLFFQQGTGSTLKNSFREAGFKDLKAERMSVSLHYPDADIAIMGAFAGGPVALAYEKFDDTTRKEAHAEYLESIAPFKNGEGYQIPGEYVVVIGNRKF